MRDKVRFVVDLMAKFEVAFPLDEARKMGAAPGEMRWLIPELLGGAAVAWWVGSVCKLVRLAVAPKAIAGPDSPKTDWTLTLRPPHRSPHFPVQPSHRFARSPARAHSPTQASAIVVRIDSGPPQLPVVGLFAVYPWLNRESPLKMFSNDFPNGAIPEPVGIGKTRNLSP